MNAEMHAAQAKVTASKARQLKEKFPELTVEIVGSWIWITVDTRPRRAELREAGLFFQRAKSAWFWKPAGKPTRGKQAMSWEHIRTKYGSYQLQDEGVA